MSRTLCPAASPRFRPLFPDWRPAQPSEFFFLENLLEARRESAFPTNAEGPDEDVNIYLSSLLASLQRLPDDSRLLGGCSPLWHPPAKTLGRLSRAHWYRVNADHRLLHLGLFDRGDGLRRRAVPFGLTAAQAREQDVSAGRSCYEAAANLLSSRHSGNQALAEVLGKLATHFESYVHVLSALATRRLGLGASLTDLELQRLLGPPPAGDSDDRPREGSAQARTAAMDDLLDGLSRYRQQPDPELENRLADLAGRLGIPAAKILKGRRAEGAG